ncbi:PadR family transcriptional regulator [Heliobacterium undosum]|uniref:PadR family transcriptional regulator n=1 Tax=Heliomicrobium undosum TaxID=121734 RepID=A0A845L4P5_9FIRM|nr:PadR family transcriptional regulator [Heliomicrobium undosum]MZP30015.1 PadR family transcriptional regulator [Heliomicrobium undosum]
MAKVNYGRHLPAFILLFLAQEPAYGLTLLKQLEQRLPHNNADSAAVYRALQELEKSEAVESYWDTSDPGPAKKWYKISPQGFRILDDFKKDIEQRKSNIEFFLSEYAKLFSKE